MKEIKKIELAINNKKIYKKNDENIIVAPICEFIDKGVKGVFVLLVDMGEKAGAIKDITIMLAPKDEVEDMMKNTTEYKGKAESLIIMLAGNLVFRIAEFVSENFYFKDKRNIN